MFVAVGDERAGVTVGVASGKCNDDADHAGTVSSVASSDAAAALQDIPHVYILVTQADSPLPPPSWRKRMAASNKCLRSKEHYMAIVAPNPLHRGVLTAILWLTGSRNNHHYAAFRTFEEAAAWVHSRSGRSYPMLPELYQRASAQLKASPEAAREART